MIKNHLKIIFLISLATLVYCNVQAQQQVSKIVAECTITYSVTIKGNDKNEGTTKTLYIKGRKIRSEIKNTAFYQATIFDNKTEEAVVLKEIGGDKYMSQFNAAQWKEKNQQWNASSVQVTNETKKILNYTCRKAIITTKEGNSFVVYFTTDMTASATENPYQFKDISGLVLEYESQTSEGKNIEFTATGINFNPVPAAKFIIPTTGYRII